MKLMMLLLMVGIFWMTGCQTNSSQITVLGEQVELGSSTPPNPTENPGKYVVNGGPGSTEAVYSDERGARQIASSNVVRIPILEKCEEPKPPELVAPEPPKFEMPEEIPELELDTVRYLMAGNAFGNQTVAKAVHPPEVRYETQAVIPRRPPQIELKKFSDEDKLCCDRSLQFRIRFTNIGGQDAYNVVISDIVPAGVAYLEETAGSEPYFAQIKTERDAEENVQKIIWEIQGPVPPESSGEIFYTVSCPKPKPKLSCYVQFEPKHIQVGEEGQVICRVNNTGVGSAFGVNLSIYIPEAIEYNGQFLGTQENFYIAELLPNQVFEKTLKIKMRRGGRLDNITARVTSSNSPACDCSIPPTPTLTIEKSGPRVITNRIPIEYTIVVKNTSEKDTMATNCLLKDRLPDLATFKLASEGGTYDGNDHTVTWYLGNLAPGAIATRTVTVIPQKTGTFVDHAQVTCDEGITVYDTARTVVRGIAALQVSSYDTEDPVEIGRTTTYVIEVINEGFQLVTDLKLIDTIPATTTLVGASAADAAGNPIEHEVDEEGRVVFHPYPALAVGEKLIYKITVKVNTKSQLKNNAAITYNEFSKTIIVEEPTESY